MSVLKTVFSNSLSLVAAIHLMQMLPTTAASADFLDTGSNYYRQGNFLAATAALTWAVKQSPNEPKAHYLLANSLVKVGRTDEARQEYQITIRLSKDSQLADYCRSALLNLSSPPPAFTGQTPTSSLNRPAAKPSTNAIVAAAAQKRAVQKINEQADTTSVGMLNASSADAASWQRTGAYRAEKARQATETTAQWMARTTHDGIPLYTQNDIAAARQSGQVQMQSELDDARDRGNRAVQFANAKVWETEAAAKNLQEQLLAPTSSGGVKMKAEGTNLYVRNFDIPFNTTPPMTATAKSLTPSIPLKAEPRLLPASKATRSGGKQSPRGSQQDEQSESTVHGEVIP